MVVVGAVLIVDVVPVAAVARTIVVVVLVAVDVSLLMEGEVMVIGKGW